MKITLIGMPGCGKTTVAKKISKAFNLNFIDTDIYIETKHKMSVSSLFQLIEELGFRKLENIAINEILQKDHVIVSTGGGLPCFENNMKFIKEKSISIFINASKDLLFKRLKNSKRTRPLIANMPDEQLKEYIDTTFSERKEFYEQADYTINPETDDILNLINRSILNKN